MILTHIPFRLTIISISVIIIIIIIVIRYCVLLITAEHRTDRRTAAVNGLQPRIAERVRSSGSERKIHKKETLRRSRPDIMILYVVATLIAMTLTFVYLLYEQPIRTAAAVTTSSTNKPVNKSHVM